MFQPPTEPRPERPNGPFIGHLEHGMCHLPTEQGFDALSAPLVGHLELVMFHRPPALGLVAPLRPVVDRSTFRTASETADSGANRALRRAPAGPSRYMDRWTFRRQ